MLSIFHETKDVFTLKVGQRREYAFLSYISRCLYSKRAGRPGRGEAGPQERRHRAVCEGGAAGAGGRQPAAPGQDWRVAAAGLRRCQRRRTRSDAGLLCAGISNFFWSFPSEAAVKARCTPASEL